MARHSLPPGNTKTGRAGRAHATIEVFAAREGLSPRWTEHIWKVVNTPELTYPTSEVAARWKKLPAPSADRKATEVQARTGCENIEKFITTWPSWLFARGDIAAGGQGDESPLIISDATLKGEPAHKFVYPLAGRGGRGPAPTGPTRVFLHGGRGRPEHHHSTRDHLAQSDRRHAGGRAKARQYRGRPRSGGCGGCQELHGTGPKPLRELLSPEWVAKLNFGHSPDGTPSGTQ